MREWISHFAAGMAVAALALVSTPAADAQQHPKPAAKAGGASPQLAAQGSAARAPEQKPAATEQTTSSLDAVGSNWRVECSVNGQILDCRAIQQVVVRKSQQLVASLMVRVPAETKKPVMMVQMPLGVLVSEAVELFVDEGKPERFTIQTCNQQGCFVGTPLPEAMLASMRSGKQLRIVFQNGDKQAITVTMPLAGFGLAYDKVKS